MAPLQPRLIHLRVGQLRGDEPMPVVSGRLDKPRIRFEAPPKNLLSQELVQFLEWFNQPINPACNPLIRAAITHLWFVTLHPFDDGNGRITRALTDRALAQTDAHTLRLFAMSSSILENRAEYYRVLEQTQRGELDITLWITWFLQTLTLSVQAAIKIMDNTLNKKHFGKHFLQHTFCRNREKY